jgi:hypothetical protein
MLWEHYSGDFVHERFNWAVQRHGQRLATLACQQYKLGGEPALRKVESELYWCRLGGYPLPGTLSINGEWKYTRAVYLLPKHREYEPGVLRRIFFFDFQACKLRNLIFSLETGEVLSNDVGKFEPGWTPRSELTTNESVYLHQREIARRVVEETRLREVAMSNMVLVAVGDSTPSGHL